MTGDPAPSWRVKGKDWAGVLRFEGRSGDALACRVDAFSATPTARVEGEIYFGDSEAELLGLVSIT